MNDASAKDPGETTAAPSAGRLIQQRFRGFLPVVVDVETGGFDPSRDALLEVAAVLLEMDDQHRLTLGRTLSCHVEPFEGANIEQSALDFTGIDPFHPFRDALPERQALDAVLGPIRQAVKAHGCSRAILVGHNAGFDLAFLRAAVTRTRYKRDPFHPFSTLDTVSLGALALGQTVLAKAAKAAGIGWDNTEAHSAIYDAEQTARLFCWIINRWAELSERAGEPLPPLG